jgi:hypothetical protein
VPPVRSLLNKEDGNLPLPPKADKKEWVKPSSMGSETAISSPGTGPFSERGGYDLLILDAEVKQSLAAARSLGKAGLRVAPGDRLPFSRIDVCNTLLADPRSGPFNAAEVGLAPSRPWP